MKIKSLKDLYLDLLRDMHNGEKQLTKALPKMAENAVSKELRAAFESHQKETEGQVERLERMFKSMDEKPSGETCEAMKGLIEEAEELIKHTDVDVMDAGLIASAQKVEHYEIASYGTLCAFAKQLGLRDQEKLLHDTLKEEKAADAKLNAIAEGHANRMAPKQAA